MACPKYLLAFRQDIVWKKGAELPMGFESRSDVFVCAKHKAKTARRGREKFPSGNLFVTESPPSAMNSWTKNEKTLAKEFMFPDFKTALAFVNKVGALAEEHDHHPDILMHDYKYVSITLTTHGAGAVTEKDEALAKEIDLLA